MRRLTRRGGATRWSRTAIAGVAALLSLTAASATAGPLDPPRSALRVWLVEPVSRTARPLTLGMRVVHTEDWGAIVLTGFRRQGRQRLVTGAAKYYVETRRGGVYPVVTRDGAQQLPACPAAALCSSPAPPGAYVDLVYTPRDATLHHYVFVRDTAVTFTVSRGWRARQVKGGELHQLRDQGTSARVSAYNSQYMVEDFRGATAPRAARASVAFATIPCWFYPLPGGSGRAVLTNDGKAAGHFRQMRCDGYVFAALGESDRPTVWRNDGASLGWSGGFVMRLVVAVLPPE